MRPAVRRRREKWQFDQIRTRQLTDRYRRETEFIKSQSENTRNINEHIFSTGLSEIAKRNKIKCNINTNIQHNRMAVLSSVKLACYMPCYSPVSN